NYSMGAVALLRSGQYDEERLLQTLEKSAQQAERAGKIISRIREFVKRSEPQRKQVSIRQILENATALADIDARKRRITIEQDVPDDIRDVIADPILIEQVLLNLLKNGLEAMEYSDYPLLHVAVSDQGPLIEVSVHDRGHGLDHPERLFEPFYSTKSQGLGMGLNICRTIIESHHGRLWADPNPQGGTIFRFTLPGASQPILSKTRECQEHDA